KRNRKGCSSIEINFKVSFAIVLWVHFADNLLVDEFADVIHWHFNVILREFCQLQPSKTQRERERERKTKLQRTLSHSYSSNWNSSPSLVPRNLVLELFIEVQMTCPCTSSFLLK